MLTRSGGKVGLVTTRGFRDVLEIRRSYRSDLDDLQWDKPRHVIPRNLVREVNERVDHSGRIATPIATANRVLFEAAPRIRS